MKTSFFLILLISCSNLFAQNTLKLYADTNYYMNDSISTIFVHDIYGKYGSDRLFHPNGQLAFKIKYDSNGHPHGKYELYYPSGNLKRIGQVDHKILKGITISFYDDGDTMKIISYKDTMFDNVDLKDFMSKNTAITAVTFPDTTYSHWKTYPWHKPRTNVPVHEIFIYVYGFEHYSKVFTKQRELSLEEDYEFKLNN